MNLWIKYLSAKIYQPITILYILLFNCITSSQFINIEHIIHENNKNESQKVAKQATLQENASNYYKKNVNYLCLVIII